MTNNELTKRYLDAYGFVKHKEYDDGEANAAIILPYLIMDIAYDVFRKSIKPLPYKYAFAKSRNKWSENYKKFNDHLFRLFDNDEQEQICDMMDELDNEVEHDLFILKINAMNCFMGQYTIEQQEVLGSLLVCSCLCRFSKALWEKQYHKYVYMSLPGKQYTDRIAHRKPCINPHLDQIIMCSRNMAVEYTKILGKKEGLVEEKIVEGLDRAIDALSNRVLLWLKKQRNKDYKKAS